jgi:hypothetical protein
MFGLAILALVVLFYLLVAYFAAKTWQVGHVVLLVVLFLGSMGFMILAAAALKTQAKWRQDYEQTAAELERALELQARLEEGDPENPEALGLRRLKGLVKRESLDRGRVWRNLRLAGLAPEGLTLSTVNWGNDYCLQVGRDLSEDEVPEPVPAPESSGTEGAEGAEGAEAGTEGSAPASVAAATPHGISVDSTVFAFKEYPVAMLSPPEKEVLYPGDSELIAQDNRGMCRVPLAYLGRYRVAQSTDQAVVLTATEPLDEQQRRIIQAQDAGTWVLYEFLAQDSHEMYQGLNAEQLRAMFPAERLQQMGLGLPPQRYAAMIERYERDGQPAAQGTDPAERVWARVRFLKEYPIDNVDVSVEGEPPPTDRPFTPAGQAQVAQLMLDKEKDKTKLVEGDVALLDLAEANRLVAQGICERQEAIYVRDLRDYEYFFGAAHGSLAKLHDQIEVAERENASLARSNEQLKAQIAVHEEERSKLEHDLSGFRAELDQLGQYQGALQRRLEHLRGEINRLHLANSRAVAGAPDAARARRSATPVASASQPPAAR